MKRLYYLRHSIKDSNNNISPEGIALAKAQGQALVPTLGYPRDDAAIPKLARIFVGPLVRTVQTRDAFLSHVADRDTLDATTAVISGIGTDELFKQFTTDEWKSAVKSGKSNFDATLEIHSYKTVDGWIDQATRTLAEMFEKMNDGEVAIAFGHSPLIELAAYALLNEELAPGFGSLKEMEGIVFEEVQHPIHSGTYIEIAGRISQPQAATAPIPKQ